MLKVAKTIDPPEWMKTKEAKAVMAALGRGCDDPAALFVGGCVRNTLLSLPEGDIDIATILPPDDVTEKLEEGGIKVIPTGIDHGTVTAVIDGVSFEITTLRRDVETDGRRAVVAYTQDWVEDAQRRDFTINTLLADGAGRIYDPTGQGLADLGAGRIVFVGDPAQRIAEDYLRILRFFRFYGYYGRGVPDAAALAACRAAAARMGTLSRERITQEFFKILALGSPAPVLDLMFGHDVLASLPHPEYASGVLQKLCMLQEKEGAPDIIARLFVLAGFHANHQEVLERFLILSNRQKKEWAALGALVEKKDLMTAMGARAAAFYNGADIVRQAVLLRAAAQDQDADAALAALAHWKAPKFPISGHDVQALGVKPGPALGQALAAVQAWWVEHDFAPDRGKCLQKLREILQKS